MDTLDRGTEYNLGTQSRKLPDCRRLPGCEDRRDFQRVSVTLPTSYRTRGLRWTRGRVLSVSASGARALFFEPLAPGQVVYLQLDLDQDWKPHVVARSVWTQEMGDRACVAGVQFENLFAEDEDRLRRWIRRRLGGDGSGYIS